MSKFWGLTVCVGKKFQLQVEEGFCISGAALEPTDSESGTYDEKPIQLYVQLESNDYLLCSLAPNQGVLQVMLNARIGSGETIVFHLKGGSAKSRLHLTGYTLPRENTATPPAALSFQKLPKSIRVSDRKGDTAAALAAAKKRVSIVESEPSYGEREMEPDSSNEDDEDEETEVNHSDIKKNLFIKGGNSIEESDDYSDDGLDDGDDEDDGLHDDDDEDDGLHDGDDEDDGLHDDDDEDDGLHDGDDDDDGLHDDDDEDDGLHDDDDEDDGLHDDDDEDDGLHDGDDDDDGLHDDDDEDDGLHDDDASDDGLDDDDDEDDDADGLAELQQFLKKLECGPKTGGKVTKTKDDVDDDSDLQLLGGDDDTRDDSDDGLGDNPFNKSELGKKKKKQLNGEDEPSSTPKKQKNQGTPNNEEKNEGTTTKTPENQHMKIKATSSAGHTPMKTFIKDGVLCKDIKVGNGQVAKEGKMVAVYYVGRLKSNNKQFDASQSGQGFKFTLGKGEVIRGWDLGVKGMKVGGKRRLTIPAQLAYGKRGAPPDIPPNATLLFDVELINVS